MVDDERLRAEFCKLVKIKCSTGAEREVADVVKAKLVDLGFEVFEDDVAGKINGDSGNVFGYLRGNTVAPALMFSAHLDSVEPCTGIEPEIKDGIIFFPRQYGVGFR